MATAFRVHSGAAILRAFIGCTSRAEGQHWVARFATCAARKRSWALYLQAMV